MNFISDRGAGLGAWRMNDLAPRDFAGHSMLCTYKAKNKSKGANRDLPENGGRGLAITGKISAANHFDSNIKR
jgi:hypothetical protein